MIQLALGVVDAVPIERRADVAEERLIHLAIERCLVRSPSIRRDVLWEAAAEVLANVERLYFEGRLDETLCGLPPSSPDADPVALMEKLASGIGLDIGPHNYTVLASTCLNALAVWALANQVLDTDHDTPTRLSWEQRVLHGLGDQAKSTDPGRGWNTRD